MASSPEDELYEANQALGRIELLCDFWDAMTKGESTVTSQIRAAIRGDADERARV